MIFIYPLFMCFFIILLSVVFFRVRVITFLICVEILSVVLSVIICYWIFFWGNFSGEIAIIACVMSMVCTSCLGLGMVVGFQRCFNSDQLRYTTGSRL